MQSIHGQTAAKPATGTGKENVPAVLTIAGFDPSSGAGITADLKVFAAYRLYGLACTTALTVQSTQGVRRVLAVEASLVTDTLECLADDVPIAGVKIGMLADADIVRSVAKWLAKYRERSPALPVVLDPVLASSSGALLLAQEAVALLRDELLPQVTVATPNFAEAVLLSGADPNTKPSRQAAESSGCALLSRTAAVVVTGGHFSAKNTPDDLLLRAGQPEAQWFQGEWVHTRATHGTGCAFSSALLCSLVHGLDLPAALLAAKTYVQGALRAAYPIGQSREVGHGPMHHLFAFDAAGRANEPKAETK